MSLYWMTVCLCTLYIFAGACNKNVNPVTAFAYWSQYLVNIFIHCVNKSALCLAEAEVTGRRLTPTQFGFGSHINRVFSTAFTSTLELILNTRPTSFSALTHGCLWISVLLLNGNISGSNGLHWCYFCSVNVECMALSLYITTKCGRLVSLHEHRTGHELAFVMRDSVSKSKRKFGCLFTTFCLKIHLILFSQRGFSSCHGSLSCLTGDF